MNKSFTLIEILVVIVVIGVLSAFIIVGTSSITNSANIAKSKTFYNSLRNSLLTNLMSEWKLDEQSGTAANDVWKGINNGTLNGFSNTTAGYGDLNTYGWMSSPNCISGTCLKFNSGKYINCGNNSILDVSSITVSAWVKTGSSVPVDWSTIIAKGEQGSNSHFWLHYRVGAFRFEYGNGTTRTNAIYNIVPANNTWYHIVGTYTSGSGYAYVNGVKGSQNTSLTGNLGTNTYNLIIGRASYADAYYWIGIIDDVKFFDSVISTSQIQQSYFLGLNKLFEKKGLTELEYNQRLTELKSNLSNNE